MTTTQTAPNQSPPFRDVNLFTSDPVLQEVLRREAPAGAAGTPAQLGKLGAVLGSSEALERGRLANEHPPRLRTFDEKGNRLDVVEFHPAYHECMAQSMAEGLHCSVWEHLAAAPQTAAPAGPRPGSHVARAGRFYMTAQMEAGHCCPITMTSAALATLRQAPGLLSVWLPKLLSRRYDRSFRPGPQKTAVTIGMGMTEKQGGTDVRANTTRAVPVANGGPEAEHLVTGHKWFLSAPMCDAFLMLAQAPGGLSCFLVPRFLPDGSVNPLRFQRLKDKLGNRSNASSEVELEGAHGWLVGEEGRGVATIIEMVTLTRLDCAVSSAGLMRLCLTNAVHHCRHRQVLGKRLVEQPMMQSVLADLALDWEAATALAFRLARSFDQAGSQVEDAWRRLMTPVTKYWVCKLGAGFATEAMECLGGNGYVEEGLLARAYRELPVNAIWEGSGNVMGLDVLRVLMKEPDAAAVVVDLLADQAKGDRLLAAHVERVRDILHRPRDIEANARTFLEGLAMAAAGCLLRAHAPAVVAEAFIASRLEGGRLRTYGAGLAKADAGRILGRVLPD